MTYDWPQVVTTDNLQVKTGDQSFTGDLKLADGSLELNDLLWKEGGTEMATGTAKLPVPEDFSKWRDTLANDQRPVAVSIHSKELPLAKLKDWLPAAAKLDPDSTGQLDVDVSGTYAKPEIDAAASLKNLTFARRSRKFRRPTSTSNLTARDGRASVEGTATAPDIPPAKLSASMPFRPAEWAAKPGVHQGGEDFRQGRSAASRPLALRRRWCPRPTILDGHRERKHRDRRRSRASRSPRAGSTWPAAAWR